MATSIITPVEIRHFHGFCGSGAGAKGFNQGHARYGSLEARFRCLGGIDNNPGALRDFHQLTGVPGTLMDLFDRQGYCDFNNKQPPAAWKEATPADILRAAGGEFPTIVFLSAPCKGFSGLLSATKSITPKYVALNSLTLRGVWLMLEAFKDEPPAFYLFENVPLLLHRGRHLVDQIMDLFRSYGYACAETVHDCGELGGLGQSRKRCLIVARHVDQVPPNLYEPPKRALRSVGDVIGGMPMPGDARGGPMHRIPNLAWKAWVLGTELCVCPRAFRRLFHLECARSDGHLGACLCFGARQARAFQPRRSRARQSAAAPLSPTVCRGHFPRRSRRAIRLASKHQ